MKQRKCCKCGAPADVEGFRMCKPCHKEAYG